jgi:hypothetical protein
MSLAFLVDGQMEKRIIQKLCPSTKVLTLNSNGRDVTPEAISKRIGSLYRLLGNRYYPVVVIIDREGRSLTATQLKRQVLSHLAKLGIPDNQMIIAVPDKMIENWILADLACIGVVAKQKSFEGKGGKGVLKKILREHDISYHETTVGVDLFCGINPVTAANNSKSFRELCKSIAPHCDWLANAGA